MNASNRGTVVGVFHDAAHAQQAIRELKADGFREDQIGLVVRHTDGTWSADTPSAANLAAGAGIGAAAGASLGALWALGIATLGFPALGPVLVGGTLMAAILASASGGAAVGTLLGALIGLGIPEADARFYEQEIHAGRTVVTVQAVDRFDLAWTVLSRNGAYDLHTANAARSEGQPARVPLDEGILERRPVSSVADSDDDVGPDGTSKVASQTSASTDRW